MYRRAAAPPPGHPVYTPPRKGIRSCLRLLEAWGPVFFQPACLLLWSRNKPLGRLWAATDFDRPLPSIHAPVRRELAFLNMDIMQDFIAYAGKYLPKQYPAPFWPMNDWERGPCGA